MQLKELINIHVKSQLIQYITDLHNEALKHEKKKEFKKYVKKQVPLDWAISNF